MSISGHRAYYTPERGQSKAEKKVFTEVIPAVDIVEENEKAVAFFEVPGADSSHIRVEVRNSNLIVEAESSFNIHDSFSFVKSFFYFFSSKLFF